MTPKRSRGMIGGGVRTETTTRAAPCSARSAAISAPLFPIPTTSTRAPTNSAPDRYSLECSTRPRNVSRPCQLGVTGSR